MVTKLTKLSTALVLAAITASASAEVTSSLNKRDFAKNEPIELIVDVTDAAAGAQLDIGSLNQDFRYLGNSQQQSSTFVNGQHSQTNKIILTLLPKRTGQLTIPSINVGSDATQAMQIRVSDQAYDPLAQGYAPQQQQGVESGNRLSLKAELSTQQTSVQQALIYTLRLTRNVNISRPQFLPPQVQAGEAIIEELTQGDEFRANIDGRDYLVFEKKYLITPQQSGELSLSPAKLVAEVEAARTNPRDIFNGAFSDPFFSSSLLSSFNRQQIEIESDAVSIDVKPIPSSFKGPDWLPASELTLSDEWQPQELKAGEPITRKIKISAVGVAANQLPNLVLGEIKGVKQYPSQPVLEQSLVNGELHSWATTEVTIIADSGGKVTFPELSMAWWDVNNQVQKQAVLPAEEIDIHGDITADNQASPIQTGTTKSDDTLNTGANTLLPETDKLVKRPFVGIAVVITLILVTLGVIALRRRHTASEQANTPSKGVNRSNPTSTDIKSNMESFKRACQHSDKQLARSSLLAVAKAMYPEHANMNLNKLSTLVDGHSSELIKELNRAIYLDSQAHWQGNNLYQSINNFFNNKQKQKEDKSKIAPLYLT